MAEQKCCEDSGKGKMIVILFVAVLLAAFIGSGIFFYLANANAKQDIYLSTYPEKNKISVTGDAETTISPNLAQLSMTVWTQEDTAVLAQSENAKTMAALKAALKAQGVKDEDVSTSYFQTDPVYKGFYVCPEETPNCTKDEKVWDYKLVGYKTTHSLSVKTGDLNNVGKILDAATAAGANDIGNVYFTLKDETEKEIKQQLLVQAVNDAKTQAQKIATASGVSLAKPLSISESYYYPSTPVYYAKAMDMAEGAAAPSTEISQGTIKISVSVSAVYEIS
jgi:uncharacterized protein YggE